MANSKKNLFAITANKTAAGALIAATIVGSGLLATPANAASIPYTNNFTNVHIDPSGNLNNDDYIDSNEVFPLMYDIAFPDGTKPGDTFVMDFSGTPYAATFSGDVLNLDKDGVTIATLTRTNNGQTVTITATDAISNYQGVTASVNLPLKGARLINGSLYDADVFYPVKFTVNGTTIDTGDQYKLHEAKGYGTGPVAHSTASTTASAGFTVNAGVYNSVSSVGGAHTITIKPASSNFEFDTSIANPVTAVYYDDDPNTASDPNNIAIQMENRIPMSNVTILKFTKDELTFTVDNVPAGQAILASTNG